MSDDHRDGARSGDYRAARVGAALALTVAVVLMVLIDALSPDYDASPITLGILGTLIAGLLAVEVPDLLWPRR